MGLFMDAFLGKPLDYEGYTHYNGIHSHVYYQQESGLISINRFGIKIRNINDYQLVKFNFKDIKSVKLRDASSNTGWGTLLVKTKSHGNFLMKIGIQGSLWLALEDAFDF